MKIPNPTHGLPKPRAMNLFRSPLNCCWEKKPPQKILEILPLNIPKKTMMLTESVGGTADVVSAGPLRSMILKKFKGSGLYLRGPATSLLQEKLSQLGLGAHQVCCARFLCGDIPQFPRGLWAMRLDSTGELPSCALHLDPCKLYSLMISL